MRAHRFLSEEEVAYVVSRHDASIHETARQLGVTPTAVRMRLQRVGLRERGRRYAKKYNVTEDFFQAIDNEVKAYTLGFILGDGCVKKVHGEFQRICITAAAKDLGHLEQLREAMGSNHQIRHEYRQSNVGKRAWHHKYILDVSSRQLSRDAKAAMERLVVAKPLERHLARGLFDADGSIGVSSRGHPWFTLSCDWRLTQWFKAFSSDVVGYQVGSVGKGHGNVYAYQIGARHAIHAVCAAMYSRSTIRLGRKYERYLEVREKCP